MKLNQVKPNIEMSSEMDGVQFSIGDQALVLDILRSKMYSDPIGSICREIGANGRDSHIEAGKPEIPIEITLPNTLDPNYRVRDFGVGLSPERIETVYTKFGTSTKRNDNKQIGAFGMGAKTPYSYSSDFSVISIYEGIKYHYTCIIDESRLGKIVKMNEEETIEPDGVEIVVPVKSADFNTFKEKTELACRHWKNPPTIKGGKLAFHKPTFSLSGDGWGIDKGASNYNGKVKLVISDFEYPLNLDEFKSPSAEVLNAVSGITYLYFETGELSLSANREQVHLDQSTTDKISAKLDAITQSFKKEVQVKIDACSNLWEANCYHHDDLRNTFSDPTFLGTLQWKGIDLSTSRSLNFKTIEAGGQEFSRYNSWTANDTLKPDELWEQSIHTIYFYPSTKLVLNDTDKKATTTQVVQLFRQDKTIQKVIVISLKDKTTWKALNKKYHLDKMDALELSKLPAYTGKIAPPPVVKKPRLLISLYDITKKAFKRVSYDKMEEDTNKKILCLLDKSYYDRRVSLPNGKLITEYELASLLDKKTGFSFYAVADTTPKDRIKEDLKGFQTFEKFITANVLDNDKISYEEIKYAESKRHYNTLYLLNIPVKDLDKKIDDPKSTLLRASHLKKYLSDLTANQIGKVRLYESLKGAISDKAISKWVKSHPEKDIVSLDNEARKKYPLLTHIGYRTGPDIQEALTHYINLMDAGPKKGRAKKTTTKGDTSI